MVVGGGGGGLGFWVRVWREREREVRNAYFYAVGFQEKLCFLLMGCYVFIFNEWNCE